MAGRTITVSNAAELGRAVAASRDGGTILLHPGNYGSYVFKSFNPTATVTFKSAVPDRDAVFSELKFNASSNMIFNDIDIRHPLNGAASSTGALTVNGSSRISFVGLDLTGSLDGNSWNDGRGILISGGDRISVLDSTFQQFNAAMIIRNAKDVIVAGNTITEVNEGVQVGGVQGGLFERNYIHGMTPNYARGEHPDAFQVYSTGVGASSDLAYRNNVIVATNGPVGGIFIRSEQAKAGIEHSNISIENNYYMGTYRHGISVSDTNGVVITGNTVLDSAKAGNSAAIMVTNVDGARIAGNIAPMFINTASTHVTSTNNIDVWESKTKLGVAVAALFAPVAAGNIDFGALNPLGSSVATNTGAGFRNVAGIGNLSGSGDAIVSNYMQMFEHSFATHLV